MRPFSLRKSAIFLTTALMTACLATTAYATEPAPAFNDVPQDSQYYTAIQGRVRGAGDCSRKRAMGHSSLMRMSRSRSSARCTCAISVLMKTALKLSGAGLKAPWLRLSTMGW